MTKDDNIIAPYWRCEILWVAAAFIVGISTPASAQTESAGASIELPLSTAGQTVSSAAGRIGERQTRDELAQAIGVKPMARINGRIQNRVQNRVRNRIDRYYDPQANVNSPFIVSGELARLSIRP